MFFQFLKAKGKPCFKEKATKQFCRLKLNILELMPVN